MRGWEGQSCCRTGAVSRDDDDGRPGSDVARRAVWRIEAAG